MKTTIYTPQCLMDFTYRELILFFSKCTIEELLDIISTDSYINPNGFEEFSRETLINMVLDMFEYRINEEGIKNKFENKPIYDNLCN